MKQPVVPAVFAGILTVCSVLAGFTDPAVEKALADPASADDAAIAKWSELGYGMFIHFGMSTFTRQRIRHRQGALHRRTRRRTSMWTSGYASRMMPA